jgi:hypothetical protein
LACSVVMDDSSEASLLGMKVSVGVLIWVMGYFKRGHQPLS